MDHLVVTLIDSNCCLVPPRVYPSPPDGNYVVRSGSTVELVCNAEGSPPPAITWARRHGNDGKLPVSRTHARSSVTHQQAWESD